MQVCSTKRLVWSRPPRKSLRELLLPLSCLEEYWLKCCQSSRKRHDRWLSAAPFGSWMCLHPRVWLDTSPHRSPPPPENTSLPLTVWPGSTDFSQGLILAVCKHINWQLIWWFCSRCACKSGVWTWQAAFRIHMGSLPKQYSTCSCRHYFSHSKQTPQMRAAAFGLAAPPRSCSIRIHLGSTCRDAAQDLSPLFRYANSSPPTLGTWWCEGFINSCNCLSSDTTLLQYQ